MSKVDCFFKKIHKKKVKITNTISSFLTYYNLLIKLFSYQYKYIKAPTHLCQSSTLITFSTCFMAEIQLNNNVMQLEQPLLVQGEERWAYSRRK